MFDACGMSIICLVVDSAADNTADNAAQILCRYIASGSEDKCCYIYDVRSPGTFVSKLQGHSDVVSDVAYNPIYPQLATASFDGTVRFYAEQ
jgi:WD40 repeat protein